MHIAVRVVRPHARQQHAQRGQLIDEQPGVGPHVRRHRAGRVVDFRAAKAREPCHILRAVERPRRMRKNRHAAGGADFVDDPLRALLRVLKHGRALHAHADDVIHALLHRLADVVFAAGEQQHAARRRARFRAHPVIRHRDKVVARLFIARNRILIAQPSIAAGRVHMQIAAQPDAIRLRHAPSSLACFRPLVYRICAEKANTTCKKHPM